MSPKQSKNSHAQETPCLRAQTLGDWHALYIASGSCPESVKPNLGGVFRRFALLVSGQDDPHAVPLRAAVGLWHRWQEDVAARQQRGELGADSAARYKSWGHRAIGWAVEHLARLDRHTDLSFLLAMSPAMYAALRWLKEHRNKAERQKVRLFFIWLDEQDIGIDALREEGTALMQRYATEVLEPSGVQTWRQTYALLVRGLRHLQQVDLVPTFHLHVLKPGPTAYALPWREIPHEAIRQQAEHYARVASDEQAFDERTGPVVRATTRDQRLVMLGRYIGFLVRVQGIDIASHAVEAVFARDNVRAFLEFLRQRQGGQTTGGTQGTLHQLQQATIAILALNKSVFAGLVDPKKIRRPSKAERVPTLDAYHVLIDHLAERVRQASTFRTRTDWASLARLHALLVLLGDCPLRSHTLRHLEVGHLERDPLSRRVALVLPADLLKGKRAYRYPLSEDAQTVLDHYLERARPMLLGERESGFLFPTRSGGALASTAFNKQLAEWDSRVRGVPLEQAVSPHRIRDMVSRTCVAYLPQKGGLVASTLLQHAGVKTLDRHYLDEVGRSAVQRNERLHRLVKKDDLSAEEVRRIVEEMRSDEDEWRRFVAVLHSGDST